MANLELKTLATAVLTCIGLTAFGPAALANSRDIAYRLFNRLNGVPPTPAKLDELAQLIEQSKHKEAAIAAVNDPGGMFYNLVLKNAVARWTNADKSPRVPLNDYTATVIGMVRDDVPFNQVLSADILYTGNVQGLAAYSLANNTHYEAMENQGAAFHQVLVKTQQSTQTGGIPADAVAGVLTTRGFGNAYYKMGTNRRAVAFALETFLCRDMESLHDTSRPDTRVRRDVTRAPGGDSALYRNRCAGCHAGMDALGGAFAHMDWNDANNTMLYTPMQVRNKMNRNASEFPDGYQTTDASWVNPWIEGPNKAVGWNGPSEGVGLRSFGEMLTSTDAFPRCMAKRAVEAMCVRPATSMEDQDAVASIAQAFKTANYNLKEAFIQAAVYCTK